MCLPSLWPRKLPFKNKKTCFLCITKFHKYQTWRIMFYHNSKHWEQSWKQNILGSISDKPPGIWKVVKILRSWILSSPSKIEENKNINCESLCWLRSDIRRPSWSWFLIFELDEMLMSLRSNISNTRDSVSSWYPNTKKRVENTIMQLSIFDELQGFW